VDFLSTLTFPGFVGGLITDGVNKLFGALEKQEAEDKSEAKADSLRSTGKDEFKKPQRTLSDLVQSNNAMLKNTDEGLRKQGAPEALTGQDLRVNPDQAKVVKEMGSMR